MIEVKVAPKKNDLESIVKLRKDFTSRNIGFYFIGGWVSASNTILGELAIENWITFLDGSKNNTPIIEKKFKKVDDILDNICNYLNR